MKTRGFTIVEAIIIVVVAAIITTLGFVAYNRFTDVKVATTEANNALITVQKIESDTDLQAATSDLDAIDLTDSSDTSTLDAQISDL